MRTLVIFTHGPPMATLCHYRPAGFATSQLPITKLQACARKAHPTSWLFLLLPGVDMGLVAWWLGNYTLLKTQVSPSVLVRFYILVLFLNVEIYPCPVQHGSASHPYCQRAGKRRIGRHRGLQTIRGTSVPF